MLSWLSVGSYEVIADYSDSNCASGKSGVAFLQVMSDTTTNLVASPNPVITGQTLGLTATVQGTGSTLPAGAVSFLNGSTLLGTGTLNASGVATLSTKSLAAGTDGLTAQYTGNASFLSSTSASVLGDGDCRALIHDDKPDGSPNPDHCRSDVDPDREPFKGLAVPCQRARSAS